MANLTITNNNVGSPELKDGVFRDELLTFAAADVAAAGTILARKLVADAIVAAADGGNTGNGTVTSATVVTGPIVPLVGAYNLECTKAVAETGTPTATAAADGGNTGNGTCTSLSVTAGDPVLPGAYNLEMIANGVAGGTATGAAVADGGNTGNGTAGAVTCGASAQKGAYIATCIDATVSGSEIFSVIAPDGTRLKDLTVGVAYATTHISLTISDGGTDFIVGDFWTITVSNAGGIWKLEDPNGGLIAGNLIMDAGASQATALEAGGIAFTLTDGATDFVIGDKFAITVANTGSVWKLVDPNGMLVANNLVASAGAGAATTFETAGMTFIITDGATDFVVGDKFSLTVSAVNKLVYFATNGLGGAQFPAAVLTYAVTATGAGDVKIRAMVGGEVKKNLLIIDADGDGSNITNAILDQMRDYGLMPVDAFELNDLDNQ